MQGRLFFTQARNGPLTLVAALLAAASVSTIASPMDAPEPSSEISSMMLPSPAITVPERVTEQPISVLTLLPGNARLSSTLAEFARENGWEIAWEIDRDFPIDYAARFEGPFLEVIGSVVASLRTTDAPIRAKVYRGNKVVRIIHATR